MDWMLEPCFCFCGVSAFRWKSSQDKEPWRDNRLLQNCKWVSYPTFVTCLSRCFSTSKRQRSYSKAESILHVFLVGWPEALFIFQHVCRLNYLSGWLHLRPTGHYKWALTQLFNKRDFRRVVILEGGSEHCLIWFGPDHCLIRTKIRVVENCKLKLFEGGSKS